MAADYARRGLTQVLSLGGGGGGGSPSRQQRRPAAAYRPEDLTWAALERNAGRPTFLRHAPYTGPLPAPGEQEARRGGADVSPLRVVDAAPGVAAAAASPGASPMTRYVRDPGHRRSYMAGLHC